MPSAAEVLSGVGARPVAASRTRGEEMPSVHVQHTRAMQIEAHNKTKRAKQGDRAIDRQGIPIVVNIVDVKKPR
jgi:hypothetical protein